MSIADFFNCVLYVRLHPDRISIRDVRKDVEISEQPVIAISRGKKKVVLGVGKETGSLNTSEVDLYNPFKHPRTLISDFTVAEVLLKKFAERVRGRGIWIELSPAPVIVIHPQVDPEGGFTQVEIRALRELAIGMGARKAIVWHGRELRRDELLKQDFSGGGEVFE